MTGQSSALYAGHVTHQRLRPERHRLRYRVFSLLIDLDELPELARRLRLFSLNRFNLFSLHERDYGAGDGRGLREYVEQQLHAAGLRTGGAIRLLSMPRILGYAFNPLSVYFCHHPDGALQAVLYEVNNTFGERHSYLIEVDASQRDSDRIMQTCVKELYVSPFLGLAMQYRFNVQPPHADRAGLSIGIGADDVHGPVLTANLDTRRQALRDSTLALAFFSHPLLTLKVVGAIHWEALRLWIKGVNLHPRPSAPARALTFIKSRKP